MSFYVPTNHTVFVLLLLAASGMTTALYLLNSFNVIQIFRFFIVITTYIRVTTSGMENALTT